MRRSSALLICSGLLVTFSSLTGCRSDPGLWSMNYKPMSNYEPIEREPSEVRFERVMSVDELKLVPQEEGLIIIGMTRFTTAPCLEPDESGAPDPKLRQFAAAAGADVVRWAGRTLEFGGGDWEDLHEYRAVFYTYEWAQSTGLTFKNPEPGSWVPQRSGESATDLASEPVDLDS
ncbi:MAG: hypothetical protein NXI14_13830 [bacterium]|nr:hypothetical protein [bacterium]